MLNQTYGATKPPLATNLCMPVLGPTCTTIMPHTARAGMFGSPTFFWKAVMFRGSEENMISPPAIAHTENSLMYSSSLCGRAGSAISSAQELDFSLRALSARHAAHLSWAALAGRVRFVRRWVVWVSSVFAALSTSVDEVRVGPAVSGVLHKTA